MIDSYMNKQLLTGIDDLDSILGGFNNSGLYIVGSRPAAGKTSLALDILVNNIDSYKSAPALFISMEMDTYSILQRMIAKSEGFESVSTLSYNRAKQNLELNDYLNELSNKNLIINDKASQSVENIIKQAKEIYSQHGKLSFIVVDYIQLVNGSVNENIRRLKLLSRELNTVVIVLAHLHRSVEDRQEKIPTVKDIRGFNDYFADVILLLSREYSDSAVDIAQINIAQNNFGSTQTIFARFDTQRAKFIQL